MPAPTPREAFRARRAKGFTTMETASELSRDLAGKAEAFCRSYLPNGKRAGTYWKVGDTSGVEGQSLQVRLVEAYGKKAGRWTDHATGEFGDLLDMLSHVKGLSNFADIAHEARVFLGRPEIRRIEPSAPIPKIGKSDGAERARRLLSISTPIAGTPAEAYLRNRGIRRFGHALSYHAGVYYRPPGSNAMRPEPAMLAAITDNDGKITGVARTWLDIERRCVADLAEPKRVMGTLYGNAVRFGRKDGILGIGEGVETMLSVGSILPALPLAACLTATHLGLFEIPDHVGELWIFRDLDDAGERGANTLAERALESGRRVVIHEPVFGDFNDDLWAFDEEGIYNRMVAEIGPLVDAYRMPE